MKRPSYRHAVEVIALNDNPSANDPVEALAGYLTVCFIAEIFGIGSERVARDVWRYRNVK